MENTYICVVNKINYFFEKNRIFNKNLDIYPYKNYKGKYNVYSKFT